MRRSSVAILLFVVSAVAHGAPPVPLAGIVAVDNTGKTVGTAIGCENAALCAVALSLDGRLLLVGVGTPASGPAGLRGANSNPYAAGDVLYADLSCESAPYLEVSAGPDSNYVAGKYVVMDGAVYVPSSQGSEQEREMSAVRHFDGLCVQFQEPMSINTIEASSLGDLGFTEPFHFTASTIVFIDGFPQPNFAGWSGHQ